MNKLEQAIKKYESIDKEKYWDKINKEWPDGFQEHLDECLKELEQGQKISNYFDGGPGYEATFMAFCWLEDGKIKTAKVLEECY